jgi:hypothetical protein
MVRISMRSTQLDTYLILTNSDDARVAANDDGGDGYNSEITMGLPESGTYTIWATTYNPNNDEIGPFTLSLSELTNA